MHIEPDRNMENRNEREYLETALIRSMENLRRLEGAPSVQRHDLLPPAFDGELML